MFWDYCERDDRYSIVMDITPEMAEAWPSRCNSHNRKVVDTHVERLTREMKRGRWRLTHEGIAFSANQMVLDGQHRLWVVFFSGITVPMRVFFNEPADSLVVIDAGQARSNDQIITLAGGLGAVDRRQLAALRARVTRLSAYTRMATGEEAPLLTRYHDAIAFAHEILPAARFRGMASSITRGVLARAFYSADLGSLRHFADVLRAGVADGKQDNSIAMLLKFLMSTGRGVCGRPETRERYAKTERVLQAYLAGEPLNRLNGPTTELFPLPSGDSGATAA